MKLGSEPEVGAVLGNYPAVCRPRQLEPLGSCGGLSGALFWRLECSRGLLCLRRWPEVHPSRERLAWTHRALRFAAPRCSFSLPLPIDTTQGRSCVEAFGHMWELTPWLAGEPAARSPLDLNRLQAAMTALAMMHLALAGFTATEHCVRTGEFGSAPGILKRLSLVRSSGTDRFPSPSHPSSGSRNRSAAVIELMRVYNGVAGTLAEQAERDLLAAGRRRVPLQVCLRDIWRPHVLFQQSHVSGIVDFGAMDVDSVACDVARLLGSMAGDEEEAWRIGLAAYEATRPLSEEERALVPTYDRSGVLLSAANWLKWLLVEGRAFPDESAVEARLVELAGRLRFHKM